MFFGRFFKEHGDTFISTISFKKRELSCDFEVVRPYVWNGIFHAQSRMGVVIDL